MRPAETPRGVKAFALRWRKAGRGESNEMLPRTVPSSSKSVTVAAPPAASGKATATFVRSPRAESEDCVTQAECPVSPGWSRDPSSTTGRPAPNVGAGLSGMTATGGTL